MLKTWMPWAKPEHDGLIKGCLGRSPAFLARPGPGLRENPGFRRGHFTRAGFRSMAVEQLAVHQLAAGAPGVAVQLPLQFLLQLFRRLFFGLLQGLPLGPGLQAQTLGPRLGALLPALLFAGVAFAADRLQIRLEVIGAVVVVDLFARLD